MRTKSLLVMWCAVCVPMVVGAQQMDSAHLFPGAARLPGQPPSQWVSDVTVHNVQGFEIEVGFLFFPELTEHGIEDIIIPADTRFRLGPRETRLFQDVLGTLFGIDDDKGILLVTCEPDILGIPPGDDDLYIIATMRTYDVSSPQGTYGQTIPASSFVVNSSGQPSFVTGAVHDGNFRSNFGIFNQSLEQVRFHYRVFRANAMIAEGSKILPPLYTQQWAFNALGVATAPGPLTVEFWLDPSNVHDWCLDTFDGGTALMAYVSKVDSRTQDAEFIYAAPAWVQDAECH